MGFLGEICFLPFPTELEKDGVSWRQRRLNLEAGTLWYFPVQFLLWA